MKVKDKMKKNGEYPACAGRSEYKKIIKIIDNAHKKALLFNKTEFQKKLERTYRFC